MAIEVSISNVGFVCEMNFFAIQSNYLFLLWKQRVQQTFVKKLVFNPTRAMTQYFLSLGPEFVQNLLWARMLKDSIDETVGFNNLLRSVDKRGAHVIFEKLIIRLSPKRMVFFPTAMLFPRSKTSTLS